MTGNRVSYTLDSTLESVNRAEEAAGKIAARAGIHEDDLSQVTMAVREAMVNAVLHGNKYDPNKKVRLAFENSGGELKIVIADEGTGVDVEHLPDPLSPENLLKQSGRGIFLIRAFMDEVRFRSLEPGTEITMIKHVRGDAADAKESSQ